jgi:membrane protein DedA with SNARE-associated domain
MILLSTVSLLAGMALAQYFKVMVLVPASLIVLVLAVATGATHTYTAWSIVFMAAAASTCIQIGYFLGIGIRQYVLAAISSRPSSLTATAASTSAQHPAR